MQSAREAARRTLGQRHYDVQLVGGMILHNTIVFSAARIWKAAIAIASISMPIMRWHTSRAAAV